MTSVNVTMGLYFEFCIMIQNYCFDPRLLQIDYVTKNVCTHGQVAENIGKVARKLMDWGVKPGDHVALSSFNHIHYFPVQLGIIASGGRVALCNPGYTG